MEALRTKLNSEVAARADETSVRSEIALSENGLATVNRISIMSEVYAAFALEMGNPLAVITGFAGQLRRSAGPGTAEERQLGRISEAADRILKALMEIQRLTHSESPRRELFSIQSALRTAIDFSQPLLRSGRIALTTDLPEGPFHCVGDADLFAQILMNLISNARDAIVSAERRLGKIGIALEESDGETFTLSISDNGTGMDEVTRSRAFHPFFTTKPPGKALGLGLAITVAAVRDFGGELRCETAPGAGSTFRITLPRTWTTR